MQKDHRVGTTVLGVGHGANLGGDISTCDVSCFLRLPCPPCPQAVLLPSSPTCPVLFKQLSNCSEKEGRKGGREAWSDSRKEQSRLGDKGKEKDASALNAN